MKLPAFELERYFARYEFDLPYLLSSSDVETHDMSELLAKADDECRRMWANLSLGYTQAPGHPLLRREIANLYDTVPDEGVLVFSGAEEAIFALSNVVVGDRADDRAAVVWPAYQSLHEVPRSAGAHVDFIELHHEDGWALERSCGIDDHVERISPLAYLGVASNPWTAATTLGVHANTGQQRLNRIHRLLGRTWRSGPRQWAVHTALTLKALHQRVDGGTTGHSPRRR